MRHNKTNGVAAFAAMLWIFALLLAPIAAQAQTSVSVSAFAQLQAAISGYNTATGDMFINVTEAFPITSGLTIPWNAAGAALTIKSADAANPVTLWRGFESTDTNNGLFTVNNGAKLVLEDIIIDGNKDVYPDNKGSLVYVGGGTFTMNGGVISGNTASAGGVYVVGSNSTFTMNGGEISGNTADLGGGVYVVIRQSVTKWKFVVYE